MTEAVSANHANWRCARFTRQFPVEIAELATAAVGYKTFPHVVMYETGVAVAKAIGQVLAGQSKPTLVLKHAPMLKDAKIA